MKRSLVLVWLGLPSLSFGQTFQNPIEVVVPESFPSNHASGVPLSYRRALAKNASWPDGVVQSNRPQVQCRVTDGVFYVDFSASDANWPSLPMRGRCLISGAFYYFRVEAMNPDLDPSSWQVEVDGSQTVAFRKREGAAWLQSFLLPPTPDFEEGEVGSSLAGTVCQVAVDTASGNRFVSVRSVESADVGAGTCELPVASGPDYTLNLDISTVITW